MALVKFQHVVSVSSEDENYKATSLLESNAGIRKWKCAAPGEKKATVVLQLTKAAKISSIDIGNEGSAFVEVLVGKSAATNQEDFHVLLPASSLLTPFESKTSKGFNKVRIFGSEALNKQTLNDAWDRIKIVCTQPFNKTIKYGLSFIKVHEHEVEKEVPVEERPTAKLFESENISAKKDKPAAAKTTNNKRLLDETHSQRAETSRARTDSPGTSAHPGSSTKRKRLNADENGSDKTSLDNEAPSTSSNFSTLMKGVTFILSGFQNPQRGQLRDKAIEMGGRYKPQWTNDCTHCVCAFPNTPKFNQVRSVGGKIVTKAWILDQYRLKRQLPWRRYRLKGKNDPGDDDSEDSADDGPPSRGGGGGRARDLGRAARASKEDPPGGEGGGGDTDEDDDDAGGGGRRGRGRRSHDDDLDYEPPPDNDRAAEEDEDDDYGDTDDEIEKVLVAQREEKKAAERVQAASPDKKADTRTKKSRSPSTSSASTVELPRSEASASTHTSPVAHTGDAAAPSPAAMPSTSKGSPGGPISSNVGRRSSPATNGSAMPLGLPPLPDHFKGLRFFLYGDMEPATRKKVLRYVYAFNGKECNFMGKDVTHVITVQDWDDAFDEALSEYQKIKFVRPSWIMACAEEDGLVPISGHQVMAA